MLGMLGMLDAGHTGDGTALPMLPPVLASLAWQLCELSVLYPAGSTKPRRRGTSPGSYIVARRHTAAARVVLKTEPAYIF
jgi:hypothetical protein